MKASFSNMACITVEQIPDGEQGREIAKAILDGTVTGYSLDVANPTRTDLAEQMLWASMDAEIGAGACPTRRGRATIPGGITSRSARACPTSSM